MKEKTYWTQEDFEIYELGRKSAFLTCLKETQKESTRSALIKRAEEVLHFLKVGYPNNVLPGHAPTVWDHDLKWTSGELSAYCRMIICDFRARLSRARDLYDMQQALINQLSQITEDING